MVDKKELLMRVAGKLMERGVRAEVDYDRSIVTGWYDSPTPPEKDNLHKQSVRGVVDRYGEDKYKIHISSMGESGFTSEVREAPGVRVAEPKPEADLTDEGVASLDRVISTAENLLRQLREIA